MSTTKEVIPPKMIPESNPPPKEPISLLSLPDEILTQILYLIPNRTSLQNISLINQRFNTLTNDPLLYRHFCLAYKHWDEKHQIQRKFADRPADTDWKRLYLYRCRAEETVERLLGEVLIQQSGRIRRFERIADFGYDAKDVLVRNCSGGDEGKDALARRFYSREIMDHVHRARALEEWSRLIEGQQVSLERGLGAFDMFVLHDEHGDLAEIMELFDDLIARLAVEVPNIHTLPPRVRAIKALEFLRRHNYLGLNSSTRYRDLQNNYIGIALQDPEHPSLPLISVAIFCGVAQRLGLDAQPCGFPNHVHALIYFPAPPTTTPSTSPEGGTTMYLDPFRSSVEIPIDHLHTQLIAWGIHPLEFHRFISHTSPRDIVLRTSRNILATIHESRNLGAMASNPNTITRTTIRGKPYADIDNAFYSALWANFMLNPRTPFSHNRDRGHFVPMIMEKFERHYPMDALLIEKYICPSYHSARGSAENEENEQIFETLRVVRSTDAMAKQVRRRGKAERERVKWKVGQLFRHRRYGYTAVIVGWDLECGQAAWIADRVDGISKGRSQSLYHALTPMLEDQLAIRYIVEENIEIIRPETPPEDLMGLAGRYFKRWDGSERVFVSNVRDEYPDD